MSATYNAFCGSLVLILWKRPSLGIEDEFRMKMSLQNRNTGILACVGLGRLNQRQPTQARMPVLHMFQRWVRGAIQTPLT